MKKNVFVILLFLLFCLGLAEAGQKIVVVQSSRIMPYEEALKGFKSVCDVKTKQLVISELNGEDVVKNIYRFRPDMVLAIGVDALRRVKIIRSIPIVYLMVPNPQSILSMETNITGVTIHIPIEKQLFSLLNTVPNIKKIGLLYDPDKTRSLAEKARIAAAIYGIQLIAKEVHSSSEVPPALMDMKGEIDVFWMLPDVTVITPETVEFMFLFSLENNIPILAFSDKYLELGAFMSIAIDAFDIGSQAGDMAKKILLGTEIKNIQQADARKADISVNQRIARKAIISINQKIAKKLRVPIDEKIIGKARLVKRGNINEYKFYENLQ